MWKLCSVDKKVFSKHISSHKDDAFAKTFVAKANMQDMWDDCVGIFDGNELLGAIIVTISKRKPVCANLQLLHTFQKHRRKGVGTELLYYAIDHAIENGAEYFRVSSEADAVPFYVTNGLQFYGKQKSGTELSICKISSDDFFECEYDINDPYINSKVYTNAKGGVVELHSAYKDKKKKCLLVIAGGGAAGKTTSTNAFAVGSHEEHIEMRDVQTVKGIRPMKVYWTVYENCAVVGSAAGGSDSNIGPGAMRESLFECLAVRDVVVLDGYVSSPQWPLFCNEWQEDNPNHELAVALIHYDLSVDELLRRKAKRLNKTVAEINTDAVYKRCLEGVARPKRLIKHFLGTCHVPMIRTTVVEQDTTDDIVAIYDGCVCEIFGDCE